MIIRKAVVEDAECIAACLLLAMKDIVYQFIGERNTDKAKAFMLHFAQMENNQYSYQNCWVAEVDNKVVGAVNIYDGARLNALRQPVMDYIKMHLYKNIKVEDETEAGEHYIDSVGVHPAEQGKGVGTKILQYLIHEYVHQGHKTLGLLVDENNAKAKRLYLNIGFKSAGKKMLLGKYMEHLQIKP